MKKEIIITPQENETISNLYYNYMAHMSILQFLLNNGPIGNKAVFDEKWDQAAKIDMALSEEKRKIEKKYKPAGDWDRFEFDFDNNRVVFIKHDT